MAEEAQKNKEEQKPKSKLPMKTIILIVGVLLLEGGTITAFKIFHKPKPAEGSDPIAPTQQEVNKDSAEVALAEGTVDNYVSGRTMIRVTLEVFAKVHKDNQEQLTTLVTEHKTEIQDAKYKGCYLLGIRLHDFIEI